MERVSKGIKLNVLGDQTKYLSVDEPLDKSHISDWKKSIDQANSNFEYAENR